MMGYGFGWMPFMGMIFWLFILFLIVAAVMAFMRPGSFHDRADNAPRRSSGLEILEDRYARGEINREEYLQKKQDILGRGSAQP
jgi:putative membrane protein